MKTIKHSEESWQSGYLQGKEDQIPVKRDLNNTRPTGKLIISHGNSHPFGEKCKTCDKIKKEYEISMGTKDKNSLHNRIHKEGFDAGYKKGYETGIKDATARMTLLLGVTKTYNGNGETGVCNGTC